jgi:hypothetical protein
MTLNEVIKKSAMEAYEAGDPTDITYGTVVSASPVKIQIDQKLILTSEFLMLTSNVMDYKVSISRDGGHEHTVNVRNGLKSGDSVILIKSKGGQKYIVLDKIIKEGGTK